MELKLSLEYRIKAFKTLLIVFILAIAFNDSVMNIAGWAYVIWKRPFQLKGRVEIDGVAGDMNK